MTKDTDATRNVVREAQTVENYDASAKQKAAKELAKANLAVADVKVSTAHNSDFAANNFTVSSPRMIEVEEKIGLIDTGCNALCLTRESQFDSVIKTNNSSISVADGKSVSIQGSGLICQKTSTTCKRFQKYRLFNTK
jgi:hypothetical protein